MSPPDLPPYQPSGDVTADKARWRALVRHARRALVTGWSPAERERAAAALREAGLRLVLEHADDTGIPGGPGVAKVPAPGSAGHRPLGGMTVTCYEPMRTEPPVEALSRAMQDAGARVLVPLTLTRPHLDWADLADPGRRGLGEQVLASVDLAFVPGLAASAAGVRLGQGGGYYDSVLPVLRELSGGAPVVLVLHDHEVVAQVPAEPHDAVVDAVLRPATGVCPVPLGRAADLTPREPG